MQKYLIFSEDEIYVASARLAKDAVMQLLSYWKVEDPLIYKLSGLLELSEFIKVANRFVGKNSILGITAIPSTLLYGIAAGANVQLLDRTYRSKKDSKVSPYNLILSDELDLINSYTNRQLKPEEIFLFEMRLCDNEVDSDFEQISASCLYVLSDMLIGKTGCIHGFPGPGCIARIISCEVRETGKLTRTTQDPFLELIAKAYIVRDQNSKEYIDMIESGAIKDVTVGFGCSDRRCSICGKPIDNCPHQKGKTYTDGGPRIIGPCFVQLDNPTEIYDFKLEAYPNYGV